MCVCMCMCSVLDEMQAQVAALNHLRSMIGLGWLCRLAVATPARLCVLLYIVTGGTG